jgi:hypothetical protein
MNKEKAYDIIDAFTKTVENKATVKYSDVNDDSARIAREYGYVVGTLNMVLYDLGLTKAQLNKLKAYTERG